MRSRSARVSAIVASLSLFAGCYGGAEEPSDVSDGGLSPITCVAPPVFPDTSCDPTERTLIYDAWFNVVQPQMCNAATRANLAACVQEARLSPVDRAYSEELMRRLRESLPTRIFCDDGAANAHAHTIATYEELTFGRVFLADDPAVAGTAPPTAARVASVLLHEVLHNKGYTHYKDVHSEGIHSVNEQVEACSIRLGTSGAPALPLGAPRARGATTEAELQPFGNPGESDGTRFFAQCPDGTALAGQQIALSTVGVTGVRMWCRPPTGSVTTPVGIASDNGLGATAMCPAGQVAVGVRARATAAFVRSLGFVCRPWSQVLADLTTSSTSLPLPANPPLPIPLSFSENSVARSCPAGMYVSALGGAYDGTFEHLRVWCRSPRRATVGAWNTTVDTITFDGTSSSRRRHEERCADQGALSGLYGYYRNGAVVRLGAYCRGTRFNGASHQVLGEHLLASAGDAPGGSAFDVSCPAGQVAVGFQARASVFGRGIGAMRALCTTMSPNALVTPVLVAGTWPANATGVLEHRCPPGQRLAGMRSGSAVYSVPFPGGTRVVDRLAPICRVFNGS